MESVTRNISPKFLKSFTPNLVFISCTPEHERNINLHEYARKYTCKIVQGRCVRRPYSELTVLITRRGYLQFMVRKTDIPTFLKDVDIHMYHYAPGMDEFDQNIRQSCTYAWRLVNLQASVMIDHCMMAAIGRISEASNLARKFDLHIALVNPEILTACNIAWAGNSLRLNKNVHTLTAKSLDDANQLLAKVSYFLDSLASVKIGDD